MHRSLRRRLSAAHAAAPCSMVTSARRKTIVLRRHRGACASASLLRRPARSRRAPCRPTSSRAALAFVRDRTHDPAIPSIEPRYSSSAMLGLLSMSRALEQPKCQSGGRRRRSAAVAGAAGFARRPAERAGRAGARNKGCGLRVVVVRGRHGRRERRYRDHPRTRAHCGAGEPAKIHASSPGNVRLCVIGAPLPQGSRASFGDFREAVPRVSEFLQAVELRDWLKIKQAFNIVQE